MLNFIFTQSFIGEKQFAHLFIQIREPSFIFLFGVGCMKFTFLFFLCFHFGSFELISDFKQLKHGSVLLPQ